MHKLCWFSLVLFACSDPITSSIDNSEDEEEAQTENEELEQDTAEVEPEVEPEILQNPTIRFASAFCSDESIWKLDLVAIDPQGNNTLKSEASSGIYRVGDSTGEPVQSLTLECDAGVCSLDAYDGYADSIMCSDASNWNFHFQIMDEEGHESSVKVVTGSIEDA